MKYDFACPECKKKYEFEMTVKERMSFSSNCDKCSKKGKGVKLEQVLNAHPKHSSWSKW